VGRRFKKVDEIDLQILSDLEVFYKEFSISKKRVDRLMNSALKNKIPCKYISEVTGLSLYTVKNLAEKKRKAEGLKTK
jgi:hypothetical protein